MAVARNHEIEPVVPVVVDPQRATAPGHGGQTRGRGDLLELPVAEIAVELIRRTGGVGDEQVDVAVIVEISRRHAPSHAHGHGGRLDPAAAGHVDEHPRSECRDRQREQTEGHDADAMDPFHR